MSKYPEDKPFCEWTPEQRREFKIDTFLDGKHWETKWAKDDFWKTPNEGNLPHYNEHSFYRLAPEPEPEIPDSIDWSHVHPDFTVLSRGGRGQPTYARLWGDNVLPYPVKMFASYKCGNMESCTVYRPGFDPEGEE